MASKVFSQQLITERFTQQKSGIKGKSDSASSKSAQKSSHSQAKHEASGSADVERADDVARKEHLNTLREFDLDWRFGPCTGITRLERWERAERHGNAPPQDIKALILEHEDEKEYIQNIWTGYPL